jgi:hypothetical protein
MKKVELVTEEKKQLELAKKQQEESLKLSRDAIASRVRQLRKELETAKRRYDGALFDSFSDGIPASLDVADDNRQPHGAVYYVSPLLEATVEQLQHGNVRSCLSDDVFELFFFSTQTAYAIGMLAGVIYADCPTSTIDRFERGLATALAACHWIIKEEKRP